MITRYEGKAKVVEDTGDEQGLVRILFKDDTTAGNGAKRDRFSGKGECCKAISSLLFKYLKKIGLENHFVRDDGPTAFMAKKVQILPLEVVVRNVAAGSLCKRTGLPEGRELPRPVLEFYYKNDDLGDPLLNEHHIDVLGLAPRKDLDEMSSQALEVNRALGELFGKAGLKLVDFKLEFGRAGSDLILADEISPDTCRLWDGERSLDKDVFRKGSGSMMDGYREVLSRIEALLNAEKEEGK